MSSRPPPHGGLDQPVFRVVEPTPAPDGSLVMAATGELDRDTAGQLLDALEQAWRSGARHAISLDLTSLTFIDAAGARTLLTCRSVAAEHGLQLVVRNLRPAVRRVLDVLGVLEALRDTAGPDHQG